MLKFSECKHVHTHTTYIKVCDIPSVILCFKHFLPKCIGFFLVFRIKLSFCLLLFSSYFLSDFCHTCVPSYLFLLLSLWFLPHLCAVLRFPLTFSLISATPVCRLTFSSYFLSDFCHTCVPSYLFLLLSLWFLPHLCAVLPFPLTFSLISATPVCRLTFSSYLLSDFCNTCVPSYLFLLLSLWFLPHLCAVLPFPLTFSLISATPVCRLTFSSYFLSDFCHTCVPSYLFLLPSLWFLPHLCAVLPFPLTFSLISATPVCRLTFSSYFLSDFCHTCVPSYLFLLPSLWFLQHLCAVLPFPLTFSLISATPVCRLTFSSYLLSDFCNTCVPSYLFLLLSLWFLPHLCAVLPFPFTFSLISATPVCRLTFSSYFLSDFCHTCVPSYLFLLLSLWFLPHLCAVLPFPFTFSLISATPVCRLTFSSYFLSDFCHTCMLP